MNLESNNRKSFVPLCTLDVTFRGELKEGGPNKIRDGDADVYD
jgi:hypothetical protein